ncbi:aminoacyl-tRNA deacylase [Rhodobacterales bacterium 52_120_T64]|nr:aminoacyl-tRNA deacylase [Rhodobacterales bacterium 52_120_T64]
MDASSKHQDSLTVSSDALLERMDQWGIAYQRHDHVPLYTVAEAKAVQHEFLATEGGGGHIKNLYLRDNKKRNYLVVSQQDRKIDLKTLPQLIDSGRLSFGSSDRLMENLGVRPGAVTPLAMITGVNAGVKLFIDESLRDCALIYAHPLVNDRTVALTPLNLERFLTELGCGFKWIKIV